MYYLNALNPGNVFHITEALTLGSAGDFSGALSKISRDTSVKLPWVKRAHIIGVEPYGHMADLAEESLEGIVKKVGKINQDRN